MGSVNIDLVVTADRLPRPGETVTGGSFAEHDGGKGGNQAVAAARLGAPTTLVAAVGADAFGQRARAALDAEGVRTDELVTDPGAVTGIALIVVDPSGENLIAVASGANATLTPDHVSAALDRLAPVSGDVVLVGHEIPTASARAALRIGRSRGATTILNPAPAEGVDRSLFGLADVLTPNRRELATIVAAEGRRLGRGQTTTSDPLAAARTLVTANAEGEGARAVLVTLGPGGSLLVTPSAEARELPAPAVSVVDTTGAGDAVNGALAAGLAAGVPLEEAARRAVSAASLSTTKPGARRGFPSREELERALAPSHDPVKSPRREA